MSDRTVIIGVGLILHRIGPDGTIQILVVREKRAKPLIHKKIGMLSVPLETQEEQDRGSTIETMLRCGREELGLQNGDMSEIFPVAAEFRLFSDVEEYDVVTRYGTARYVGNPDRRLVSLSGDTEVVGWMTISQLLAQPLIRVETRPVCEHFLRCSLHQDW